MGDPQTEADLVDTLQRLGYRYTSPEEIAIERAGTASPLLLSRLTLALGRLNPTLTTAALAQVVGRISQLTLGTQPDACSRFSDTLAQGLVVPGTDGSVRLFDYEDPARNDLVVTRGFAIEGTSGAINAGVMIFVNGLPLVLIGCIAPGGPSTALDAGAAFFKYVVDEASIRLGNAAFQLLTSVQLFVVTDGCEARYAPSGDMTMPWGRWRDTYPWTNDEVGQLLSRPPFPADLLLVGMLTPRNLLAIVRDFICFETTPAGSSRRLATAVQFRTVGAVLTRVVGATSPRDRSGVIAHAFGTGNTLTMMWLTRRLCREPSLAQPMVLVVADPRWRREAIAATFGSHGIVVEKTTNAELRQRILDPHGAVIVTSPQIFDHPESMGFDLESDQMVSDTRLAPNVIVLRLDPPQGEDSRRTWGLRTMLPEATVIDLITFFSTRSWLTQGPLFDVYWFREAIEDGLFVPVRYDFRQGIISPIEEPDPLFVDIDRFESSSLTPSRILALPDVLRRVSVDLAAHFRAVVRPLGGKAVVVVEERRAALFCRDRLLTEGGLEATAVISADSRDDLGVRNDPAVTERDALLARFRDPNDPLDVLIVTRTFATEFQWPLVHAVYLVAQANPELLVQVMAHLFRRGPAKVRGLLIDYWGVREMIMAAVEGGGPSLLGTGE